MVAGASRWQALRAGCGALVACLLALVFAVDPGDTKPTTVNAYLPWHAAVVDANGNLQPWYRPHAGLGYDHVLRLGWRFVERNVPVDARTGRRVYLNFAVFDDRTHQGTYWQHNPAGLYASFVDSLLPWYAYSGDTRAVSIVREMLDYQLEHGTTPRRWAWAHVPFATSCAGDTQYGRCLAGMPRSFYGGTEPDKVGLLGFAYARFYELTGERRFLRAAIRCADALAAHVRPGDVAHSPWPFRIDARTGRTLEHAEYGGMIVAPIELFDELIRLHAGNALAYSHARALAWAWLMRQPLDPRSPDFNRWSGHYEDIDYDTDDLNQATPTMTALYLLGQSSPASIDPVWRRHVRQLVDWVQSYLGRGPFVGARAIDEQRNPGAFACCSPAGLGSDTARWAVANLLLGARTQQQSRRATGRHSLAYATYFMRSNGAVTCCGAKYPQSYWFSDGYADYLKSFSWALAADPVIAPPGQDHILGSTSVVQRVTTEAERMAYRTFAPRSVEVLRLSFVPTHVVAGRDSLPRRNDLQHQGFTVHRIGSADAIVRIRHDSARTILLAR